MKTFFVTVEEASRDLRALVKKLLANGDRAVLTESGEHLVEVLPLTSQSDGGSVRTHLPQAAPRVTYDELTGLVVIAERASKPRPVDVP